MDTTIISIGMDTSNLIFQISQLIHYITHNHNQLQQQPPPLHPQPPPPPQQQQQQQPKEVEEQRVNNFQIS